MAKKDMVAPRVGAWIEISHMGRSKRNIRVAPRVGAWIEIKKHMKGMRWISVAPRVGAWIEITQKKQSQLAFVSLPVWERG